eukprot:6040616-Prymnesium_polylepis.2
MGCASARAKVADVQLASGDGDEGEDVPSNVIIPDETARPLVWSSNLLLVTSLVSWTHGEQGIAVTSAVVWVTS